MLFVDIGSIRDDKGLSLEAHLECKGEVIGVPRDDVEFSGPVKVDAEVTHTGDEVMIVRAKVSTTLSSPCSRCLAPTEQRLSVNLVEEYRPEMDVDEDTQTDDIRVYSGDAIDLTDAVRDAVIMATPIRMLCKEDCAGLCSMCGTNLNTSSCDCSPPADPRLESLAKLLKP